MVAINEVELACLETTASAPALRTDSGECMVKRMTFVAGAIRRIRRNVSMPVMRGIEMSSKTRSGVNSVTRSMASSPSPASPHTVYGLFASRDLMPRRIIS